METDMKEREGMTVNCPTCGREYVLDKWSILDWVDQLGREQEYEPEEIPHDDEHMEKLKEL